MRRSSWTRRPSHQGQLSERDDRRDRRGTRTDQVVAAADAEERTKAFVDKLLRWNTIAALKPRLRQQDQKRELAVRHPCCRPRF